jgi:hypothetical protein
MQKFFWIALFVGGYIWMVTTGNEDLVIERGKAIYKMFSDWLQDADVDFQLKKKKVSQQKPERQRRWD